MYEKTEESLRAQREQDPDAFAKQIYDIRAALSLYLDAVSLRGAAREIGMSATGLSNFLNGSEPYMPTVAKLRRWHAAHSGAGEAPPPLGPPET